MSLALAKSLANAKAASVFSFASRIANSWMPLKPKSRRADSGPQIFSIGSGGTTGGSVRNLPAGPTRYADLGTGLTPNSLIPPVGFFLQCMKL
jgi:hypothetical protein